jgi:hypothetical protein
MKNWRIGLHEGAALGLAAVVVLTWLAFVRNEDPLASVLVLVAGASTLGIVLTLASIKSKRDRRR